MLSEKQIEYFVDHPADFMRFFLGATLWSKQEEIANALATHNKVSVRSCHGAGKSYLAAGLVCWFLMMHPESKIITTAPTIRQVKGVLWAEIHRMALKLKEKVSDIGELTQIGWRINQFHWAHGMSTDDPDSFQGQHEEHMLIIFDEACGISDSIYTAANACITSPLNKILLIGNPTKPNTYFHRTHTGDVPGYKKIRISAFDTPNIVKLPSSQWINRDPLPYPKLVTMDWINSFIREHGKDSGQVRARVYGEFPSSSEDQLIDGRHIAVSIKKGSMLREILKIVGTDRRVLSSDEIARITGRK
jgi:phage terminase large subunit